MSGWFGESWGAPCCDPEQHMPTPVGDLCTQCAQPIKENDQGMLIPFAGMTPPVLSAYHLKCFLHNIVGYDAALLTGTKPPSITCPVCHKTSYNPNDIHSGYCGNCKDWTTPDPEQGR